ncbi:zinc finger, C3HC4 type (RING finger) protein [Cryptosporidium felis]|nr:zinc finger, C3HC4 type (RING finger) protein [Cryptosporidium felis]
MSKNTIFYKLKSEKKFKELNHEFPALLSHVRSKLKDILDVGEDMDILFTPSNKNGKVSNTYLSDYELLNEGTYLNVVRLPKDLAKPLHEAANAKIKNKPPSSHSTSVNASPSPVPSSTATNAALDSSLSSPQTTLGHPSSRRFESTKREEPKEEFPGPPVSGSLSNSSEDAAILSVMQQHGEKFRQTAAQRNEMLEQFNSRGSLKSGAAAGGRFGPPASSFSPFPAPGLFRADPYKRPGPVGAPGQYPGASNYNSSFGGASQGPTGYKAQLGSNCPTDVPADYICHMCGERGHHIRVCPKVNEGVSQKKIRPATGIPRSFLRSINFDEEGRLYSEVYCLPDGTFAVLKDAKQLSSTAFLTRTVEDTIGKHMGKSKEDTSLVRDSLTCPICARLFRYAVLTPCCGETYCQECIINFIRNHMDAASGVSPNTIKGFCPHCSTVISIADLEPNNPIRKSVNVALGLQPN